MSGQLSSIVEADCRVMREAGLLWPKLVGKRLLLTGAAGFLPSYLVHALMSYNEISGNAPIEVIGLVRNLNRAKARFACYAERTDLQLIEHDVSTPLHVDAPLHYIVHAASQASPAYFRRDPVGTLTPNVLGTQWLLSLAHRHNVESFVFVSSGEVYGTLGDEAMPLKEATPGHVDLHNVRSCYAESKRMGEVMCVAWGHQHGVPAKIVRPFHTYGPGLDLDDGRVFADFVGSVVRKKDIVLRSNGLAQRSFCYITDSIVALLLVMLSGKNGEAYNVGNPATEITMRDLADLVASLDVSQGIKVVHHEGPADDPYMPSPLQRNCPSINKLETLGWACSVGLKEGFERTIRSYLG